MFLIWVFEDLRTAESEEGAVAKIELIPFSLSTSFLHAI